MLLSGFEILAREFECRYGSQTGYSHWPLFDYCELDLIDLSADYISQSFSFSGTFIQKSQVQAIKFVEGFSSIDFIPKEILQEFPNVNGLVFQSYRSPVIKDNVFTSDFIEVKYLSLRWCEIQSIEPGAFRHLIKLKWIALGSNQIKSLPLKLFQNNPELGYINFEDNKINSINPNFFDGLHELEYVGFVFNECVKDRFEYQTKDLQNILQSQLLPCYSNCQSDPICSSQDTQTTTTETMTTEMIEIVDIRASVVPIEITITEMEIEISTVIPEYDIIETLKKEVMQLSKMLIKIEEAAAEKFDEFKRNFIKKFF